MGLEVVIPTSLLTALQEKGQNLSNKLSDLSEDIGNDAYAHAQEEVPTRTHNLQGSLRLESTGPFSYIIYPDQGVAPYALYVILGHMTRPVTVDGGSQGKMSYHGNVHFVEGNPFLDRASDDTESNVEDRLQQLEDWCSNLDS